MADRKPGPVKPPVIEGVAREAAPRPETAAPAPAAESRPAPVTDSMAESKPETKPETKPEPQPEPVSPPRAEAKPEPKSEAKPVPPQSSINKPSAPPPESMKRPTTAASQPNWPLLGGVGIGGAVLGTLLTYLLANVLALPSPMAPLPDPTPRLVAVEERADGIELRLGALEASAARTQVSLDATIAQLDTGVTELKKAIEDVRAAIPAPVAVDLSGIEAELKTLKSRIDALAAGISGGDADAISQSIATLDQSIATLATRIDGVDGRLSAIDGTTASLRTDLEAARKLLNDHISSALPSEVGPALKLPLILSGLETAFDSGRPFTLELQALAGVLPDLAIPERLNTASGDGLVRPEILLQRFEATLPEMLSARSGSKGDWATDALDWLKSLLALRPAEEMEGDTPDAIVSRLEAAMERRDYQAATGLMAALPIEMRNAAGAVSEDIAVHADADSLLAQLRGRALAGVEPSP